MGNSASKVGRVLPTKAQTTPQTGRKPTNVTSTPSHAPRASETRDKAIEIDGKDPQLLANLSKIGQVRINNAATTVKTASQIADSYRARDISEQQAASQQPVQNRLTAASLSNLLDERKFATSRADLERLAALYSIDIGVLDNLGRFVNTPSVEEGLVVRKVSSENGQEKITMSAVWVEPALALGEKANT